jgi:hypothetical protein
VRISHHDQGSGPAVDPLSDDPREAFWLRRLLETFPGAELLDDDDPWALDREQRWAAPPETERSSHR